MRGWVSTWQGPAKQVTHAVRWWGPKLVLVCDKDFEVLEAVIREGHVVTCLECLGARNA